MATVTGVIKYYVDFDNDGVFDAGDEITRYVKDANWAIGMHQPNQLVGDETRLELTLNNHDKRFSVELSTSPYFNKLLPQRRVQVVAVYGGVETILYTGYLDLVSPSPIDGKTARLTATGAKQYMQDQVINLPLLENVRSDEVIEAIIEKLHLPPAITNTWVLGVYSSLGVDTYLNDLSVGLDLDVGDSTFPYVADNWDSSFQGNQYVKKGDWQSGFRGYTAIADVVKAEQGRFFFGREGEAVFWNRSRLQLKVDLDASYTESNFINALYEYGKRIYNDVKVMAYPRDTSVDYSIVYETREDFEITAGDEPVTKSQRIKYTTAEGATLSVTDAYVDNISLLNGSALSDYEVEFDARSAKFEWTAAAGEYYGHTNLVIRGKPLTTYNKYEAQVIDGTSISLYGRRELVIDSKVTADENLALSIAEYNLNKFANPRGEMVWVEFLVDSDAKFSDALSRLMGDRIRVSDSQTGHEADYYIIGERHDVGLRWGHKVRWYLERGDMSDAWILGTDGFSELGVTTILGV